MTKEFHLSPTEQERMLPEDRADLLSMYKLQANVDTERRKEEDEKQKDNARRAKRRKGSKLQQMEDNVRKQGGAAVI